MLKLGNYTSLAKDYSKYRPAYSKSIIRLLLNKKLKSKPILEIGAGTGIFTKLLLKISKNLLAIEPNKKMLDELKKKIKVKSKKCKAEEFKYKPNSYDLIAAASCFHWINYKKIYRQLGYSIRLNGFFLVIYNSRDLKYGKFIPKVEKALQSFGGGFSDNRISSGNSKNVEENIKKFANITGLKVIKKGALIHYEIFSKKRYVGAWNSSNELRAKLKEKKYNKFVQWLNNNFPKKKIKAKYLNKYWLLQKVKK